MLTGDAAAYGRMGWVNQEDMHHNNLLLFLIVDMPVFNELISDILVLSVISVKTEKCEQKNYFS
jgi:hypothetical protein